MKRLTTACEAQIRNRTPEEACAIYGSEAIAADNKRKEREAKRKARRDARFQRKVKREMNSHLKSIGIKPETVEIYFTGNRGGSMETATVATTFFCGVSLELRNDNNPFHGQCFWLESSGRTIRCKADLAHFFREV